MADEESGWWNSWIQTAKEKSASVLELVRHDLAEFSQTVQQETSSAVSAAASSLKEKLRIDDQDSTANHMKRSVSTFLGSVSTAFTPVREVEDEDDVCIIQNLEPVVMDRLQLQMHLIQRDQSTYLEEPSENLEHYEKWLESFDLDSKQDEIRDLVVANSVVRTMYAKLVPTVPHMVFWHRYFYRIQQLTDAEKRRLDLKERASLTKTDDCLSWDEDEDFGTQELTPQQTDLLLMEYQQECEQSARCDQKDEVNTCEAVDNAIERQSPDSSELILSLELVQEQEDDTVNEDSVDGNLPLLPTVTCTTEEEESNLTEGVDESQEELPASVEKCNPEVLDENVAAVVSAEAEVKSSEDSSLSNEEEWEKDFDIGDMDIQNASQSGTEASANAIDLNVVNAENDWESWE